MAFVLSLLLPLLLAPASAPAPAPAPAGGSLLLMLLGVGGLLLGLAPGVGGLLLGLGLAPVLMTPSPRVTASLLFSDPEPEPEEGPAASCAAPVRRVWRGARGQRVRLGRCFGQAKTN